MRGDKNRKKKRRRNNAPDASECSEAKGRGEEPQSKKQRPADRGVGNDLLLEACSYGENAARDENANAIKNPLKYPESQGEDRTRMEKKFEYKEHQFHNIWHKVELLLPRGGRTALNYEIKDLSTGVSTAYLRDSQIWVGVYGRDSCEPKLEETEEQGDRQLIYWNTLKARMPELISSYYDADIQFKKAWLYQTVKIISSFHKKGRPFRNIIVPSLLVSGQYSAATQTFLKGRRHKAPSQISFMGNDLMRLGNFLPETCTLLTHTAPEELLGDTTRSPKKDIWSLGHLAHDLFVAKPLIRDDETDSKFAQLMKIFKVCGTPSERTWKGVSKLPFYNQQYPMWTVEAGVLRMRIKASIRNGLNGHAEETSDFISKLLVLNPNDRLSAEQALQHPFFDDVRKYEIRTPSGKAVARDWPMETKDGQFDIAKNMIRLMDLEHHPNSPRPYFRQTEIDTSKRKILVDWIIGLVRQKRLSQDTLFLGVQLLDKYVEMDDNVKLFEFQMLGEVCVLIASKVVDTVRLTLDELADIPEERYEVRQMRQAERKVLSTVSVGNMPVIHPLYFLRSFFAVLPQDSKDADFSTQCLASYLAEMHLVHFSTQSHHRPSTVAMAAFLLAVSGSPTDIVIPAEFQAVGREIVQREDFKRCIESLHHVWEQQRTTLSSESVLREKYSNRLFNNVAALQPSYVKLLIETTRARVEGRDPAVVLPTAVALRMLMFLDIPAACLLSCVSKRWHQICYNPNHVRVKWNLRRHKEVINSNTVKSLIPRLNGVRQLNLFRCKLTAEAIRMIMKHCRNLRELDLSYTVCDRSPRHIIELTGDTKKEATPMDVAHGEFETPAHESKGSLFPPELEKLNLRRSEVVEEDLKEEGVVEILRGCPNLRVLNLGMLQCVKEKTIDAIVETMAGKLEELHLNSCPNIRNDELVKLADPCKALRRLYLDMCSKINDFGITALAGGCQLEILSLCANRVSDTSLAAIAQHCKNLKSLELSFCYLVTTDGVRDIAKGCRNITHLNLCLVDMIQDDAIETLASCCNLVELNLRGCTHITDKSLEALATHCPNLRVLHLLGCEKVSASTVAVLQQRIKNVKIIIW